jgi:transposase InsO family protein
VTGHIISIIDKVETFTEKRVKTLRSNNGGEFVNNKLAAYLDKKDIVAEKALPYHHYQNGMIKRFNRRAAAMARSILLDSSLPQSFWSYAFIWAAHTLNRIPNQASGKSHLLKLFFTINPNLGISECLVALGTLTYL